MDNELTNSIMRAYGEAVMALVRLRKARAEFQYHRDLLTAYGREVGVEASQTMGRADAVIGLALDAATDARDCIMRVLDIEEGAEWQ